MEQKVSAELAKEEAVVWATGEQPVFQVGDQIRVDTRVPIGHYRVPQYLRGKEGSVVEIIEPAGIDNEEEGYGRNAGARRHYYRIAVPMREIWPEYAGADRDELRIEVFEAWLEKI